jgi:hypothetical protein
MSDDVLAGFSTDRVAAWYRRLANFTIARAAELQPSLAGAFLLKWLDNRASTATYNFRRAGSSQAGYGGLRGSALPPGRVPHEPEGSREKWRDVGRNPAAPKVRAGSRSGTWPAN